MNAPIRMLFLAAVLGASPMVLAKAAPVAPDDDPGPAPVASTARPVVARERDRARDSEGIRAAEEHTLMPQAPEVAVPRLDLQSIAGQSGIRGDTPEKARQRLQAKLQKK